MKMTEKQQERLAEHLVEAREEVRDQFRELLADELREYEADFWDTYAQDIESEANVMALEWLAEAELA